MVTPKTIHSVSPRPSKWRRIVGFKLALALITVSFVWYFTPINRVFYDWSVQRHDKIAEQQFEVECPSYPSTGHAGINTHDFQSGGGQVSDECGRMLFGNPGLEFIIVSVLMMVAGVGGILLCIALVLRRVI